MDRIREMSIYCGRTIFILDVSEYMHPVYTLLPFIRGIVGSGTWGCFKGAFRMNTALLSWVGQLMDCVAIASYNG